MSVNITEYIGDILKLIEKRKAYELSVIEYLENKKPIDKEIDKLKDDYRGVEKFLDSHTRNHVPSEDEKRVFDYLEKSIDAYGGQKQGKTVNVEVFCEGFLGFDDEDLREAFYMSLEEPRCLDEPTEVEVQAFLHIRYNRLDELKKLLGSVRLEVKYDMLTMLMYAVSLKRLDIVKLLVENNAKKDVVDERGRSAIQLIALNSSGDEMLDYMIHNGFLNCENKELSAILFPNGDASQIDLGCIDGFNATPLHYIAARGKCDILGKISLERAKYEQKDKANMTCFDRAAQNGQLEVLKLLLEKSGIQCEYSNEVIQSIIKVATGNCKLNVIQWWFQNVKSIPTDFVKRNCLLHRIWVSSNDSDIKATVEYFLSQQDFSGVSINDVDASGNTILNTSYMHKYDPVSVPLVEFFIQKGINVAAKNNQNISLIHRAVSSGNLELVQYLLTKELKIDDVDKNGNTSLVLASKKGFSDIVKFIVDKNLSNDFMNKADDEGFTALDYALRNRFDKITDALILKESRIAEAIRVGDLHNFISFKKYIPYPQLLLTDLDALCRSMLKVENASISNYIDVYPWRLDEYQTLVEQKVPISDYTKYGRLLYSNYNNEKEVNEEFGEECDEREYSAVVKRTFLKLSIKNIEKLNLLESKTRYSSTLLHISAAYGRNDIVFWLFLNKFNMKSVDDYGNTALYYAAMNNLPETVVLLKLLGLEELFIGECQFINGHTHQYVIGSDGEFHEKLVLYQIQKTVALCNKYQVPTPCKEAMRKKYPQCF